MVVVNTRQALLPKAKGWGQWWLSRVDNLICHSQHRAWLFLLHRKSIVHSPCLSLYFRPICKTQKIEHELVHGFSNNSLPCKQMTTFLPCFWFSTQLVNVPLLLQNESAAKYRKILTKITGLSSGTSSELSSMESVSQLVLTIYHPSWMTTGDWSNYFPPNSIVIYRRNLLDV